MDHRWGRWSRCCSCRCLSAGIRLNMETISYSLNDVALMVKRHSHDLRNALNGIELELMVLEGEATDAATRKAIERLRDSGAEMSRLIQGLSSKYSLEGAGSVPAIQLAELWNADARSVAAGVELEWNIRLSCECIVVEVGLARTLLKDVLELAVRIGGKRPLQIECHSEGGCVLFSIAAASGAVGAGIIDSQQAFWAALRRLGERTQAGISPMTLSCVGSFPMCVSFRVQPPGS